MDSSRSDQLKRLRERIEGSRYQVDPQAVAGAIVDRLMACSAQAARPATLRGPASGASGDVLEAR